MAVSHLQHQASPWLHRCRCGAVAASCIAAVVAVLALTPAPASSSDLGSSAADLPATLGLWQLAGSPILDSQEAHEAIAENLMHAAGGRLREEDRHTVVASVARGFRDFAEHFRQRSPRAVAALDAVRLTAGEHGAVLSALQLTGDPRVRALGLVAIRETERKVQQQNHDSDSQLDSKVASLRARFGSELSSLPRLPSAARARPGLWGLHFTRADGNRSSQSRDRAAAASSSEAVDHLTAVLVRRRLMAKVGPMPSLPIAAPLRDLREPSPPPPPSLLEASWTPAAPIRDLRRPSLAIFLDESQLPPAPLRDARVPTPPPSPATARLSKAELTDELPELPQVSSSPSSPFLAPLRKPGRDTREFQPSAAPPPVLTTTTSVGVREEPSASLASFVPPPGMSASVMEQLRAYLGIVEVLAAPAWDAAAVWEALGPASLCSSNDERMSMGQLMSCPLQFGSIGLGLLLDRQ